MRTSDHDPLNPWLSSEFNTALDEQQQLKQSALDDVSWAKAVTTYPLLSSLLLQLYRTTPVGHPEQEARSVRFYDLCRELPHILSTPTMSLSNQQLMMLAYSLNTATFALFPSTVKERLYNDALFDEKRIAQQLDISFVLAIFQEAQEASRLFDEAEENSLRLFFNQYRFFQSQQESLHPAASKLFSLMQCQIDSSINILMRQQWLHLFLQTPYGHELRARYAELQKCAGWSYHDRWLMISELTRRHMGVPLVDLIGAQAESILQKIPTIEDNLCHMVASVQAKKTALTCALLSLVDHSSQNWNWGIFSVAQVASENTYSPSIPFNEATRGSTALRLAPYAQKALSWFKWGSAGASRAVTLSPFSSLISMGGSMCGYLQGAALWYHQRHRLTYFIYKLQGQNTYSILRAHIEAHLAVFLSTLTPGSTLSDT